MCDDFCVGIYPVAFGPVYAASKHGVIGFTRSMGVKFCPYMNLVGKYRIQQFVKLTLNSNRFLNLFFKVLMYLLGGGGGAEGYIIKR